MIKNITMPSGGQTTDKSMIAKWLVKEGSKVNRGDVLLEIETDKATLSVESFTKGTLLKILVPEGEYAVAGDVIAYVGDEKDLEQLDQKTAPKTVADTSKGQEASSEQVVEDEYQPIIKGQQVSQSAQALPRAEVEHVKAMPNAKMLAKENGINLAEVASFMNTEFVTKLDVEKYLQAQEDKNVATSKAETSKVTGDSPDYVTVPLTNMRKVIAARMLQSTQTIPTFNLSVDVDMAKCIELRTLINSGKDNLKVSYNDILFKCMSAAISKYPLVNASFTEAFIKIYKNVNIGLAVSVENGLVVPVCKNVNNLSVSEISRVNKENVKSAREGSLKPEDMSGGTITLSNLGMYTVKHFTAIINPPEVCILAIGQTEEKPVYVNGNIKAVPTMTITATFDHRVIDGAYGAEFMQELKHIIENPALMAI